MIKLTLITVGTLKEDYLKDATKGEADLTVAMGTHTFLKVKAELTNKKEGDTE